MKDAANDEPGELTEVHAAGVLGKATTSAAVERVLTSPDPWAALGAEVERIGNEQEREAGS